MGKSEVKAWTLFDSYDTRNASLKRPVKSAHSLGRRTRRVATEEYPSSRLFFKSESNCLSFVSHSERTFVYTLGNARNDIDSQFNTPRRAGKAIEFEKTTRTPRTMDEDFEKKHTNSFRANERVAHFSRSVSMNTNANKNTVLTRSSCNASKDDGRAGSLEILDSRTGRKYVIPITSDGTINASGV